MIRLFILSLFAISTTLANESLFGGALQPSIYLDMAGSAIDGAHFEDIPSGAHDATGDFVVQGLEPSLSLRTDHIHGFVNWNIFFDGEDWGDENEEAFLKLVDLPGDVSIRGGRMLSRFGALNATHLHGREWRDNPFVLTDFLGEEGLSFEGGEVTIPLPAFRNINLALSASFGEVRAHDDHGHDEEGEEHHDDEEEHHDDEEEHHDDDEEEEHHDDEEDDHDDEEHHDEDEIAFADDLTTLRLVGAWNRTDFHQFRGGASLALGEDEDGEDLTVSGLDLTYTWRANGLEPGGRELRWTNEILHRDHGGGDSQLGAYTQALYRFDTPFAAGLRVDAVEAEEDDWFRVSPLLAWHAHDAATVRLQGNHIEGPDGDAQSVTLGLSVRFGQQNEVR